MELGSLALIDVEEGDIEERDRGRSRSIDEARTLEHLVTHMPKSKWCEACQRAKMQHKQCRRSQKLSGRFGELVTIDHTVIGSSQESAYD